MQLAGRLLTAPLYSRCAIFPLSWSASAVRSIAMRAQATTLYPFVPSGPSFSLALDFFAALGFEKTWQQEGLAGLRFGGAYFLLQDIDAPEWQRNQQVTFEVNDLNAYWSEVTIPRQSRRHSETVSRSKRLWLRCSSRAARGSHHTVACYLMRRSCSSRSSSFSCCLM